jgi:hypothetical protein
MSAIFTRPPTGWVSRTSVIHTFERVPITSLQRQIDEMAATYDEFPDDAARTRVIMEKIKQGAPVQPVYAETDDPHCFIMEVRHRIVAFAQLGLPHVTVCRCHVAP